MELRALAQRRLLPAALPATALARLLRTQLRHGRGERDLLPAAEARGGRELGRDEPVGLSLCRQDEPLHHASQAAARPRRRRPTLLRPDRAACPVAEARTGTLAAPGHLPPRRPAARGRAGEASARAPLLRVQARELVRSRGVRAAARPRRRTRDRRRPAAAVPDARAHQ